MRKLKKIAVNPVIVELNDTSNDIYMQLNMCILTNDANLNKAQFTDDFIDGVVGNKNKYIGIPLVGSRDKLENGRYKNLSHEYNSKTKQLNTDIIGSFTDFWKEEVDGVSKLMGAARVLKRYPNVCDAIKELYDNDELRFSCEVLVYSYGEKLDNGVRPIPYTDGETVNELFGSCVVTYPAEVRSEATLLIAQALEKDLGGEQVSDFNKGNNIKFHIESASLKLEDVSNQIYNLLNPVNPKNNNREYNYWIRDLYNDKVIVGDWNEYDTHFSINYSIENDMVVLEDRANWIEGTIGFIPANTDVSSLLAERNSLQLELNLKIEKIKEVQEQMKTVEELQADVTSLDAKNTELSTKVGELNGLVVSQEETIKGLQTKEQELSAQVEELKPFKDQIETAEKQSKRDALVEKFGKVLSEEVMKSDDVKSAIEELNEVKLNEIVVAEVVKQKVNKGASGRDVVVAATNADDLVPQDRKTRLYGPKS